MADRRQGRRAWLKAIAGGALGAAGAGGFIAEALAKGDLPTTSGLHRLEGTATINGHPAKVGTPVAVGDRVVTGPGSQAVIVLKGDAYLLRAATVVEFRGREGVLDRLLIDTGKVLSVFSKRPLAIQAASATIGIRGTGCYIEIDPASVYFCLCYGEAAIEGPGIEATRNVKTSHHEEPLLLTDDGGKLRIAPGNFRDHTDAELVMLEALVGREQPFMLGGGRYPANRY